ncbi:butyrophilin subfamily 1 member A1 [Alligator mississippiensis]|uniref:butyrophilin subfamily 1 member A1 n=1 Tax=Alligator mississippiensis TaxID=8496 RepID=UPI00090719E9|nr:butyrophilin subfamily 1 member A1 [Alligator mississippiensis]
MKVRWFQNKFSSPVHLYHAGKDQDREQMPEYNGRTQLLKDGIGDGNVTLRILSIRTSDEGQYHCFVENGTYYEEGILELKVAAIGSEPLISVEDYQDGGIWVACQGSGWYPEPEMAWKNPGGQHLQSVSKTEAQKEHGLFEKQNSIIIREDSSEILSCSITNSHLHQEKICRIYISGPFFPSVSSWMVAFSVNLVVSLIFITLTIYLFKVKGKLEEELKWRRKAKHPEILTLDAETAHPILVLSHDLKSVRWGQKRKILPENPKRFDTWRCVLTCEGFTTGKHYWEVRLEGKGDWVVGVAKESAGRKGFISFNPEYGFWALQKWGGQYQACTSPVTHLTLNKTPTIIQVYLDCEGGWVIFTDVVNETHIFSFPKASFEGERILPWVGLGVGCGLKLYP